MTAPVSSPRTAYDDLAALEQLHDDCVAADAHLQLSVATREEIRTAPSMHLEERAPQDVDLLAAAQLLARALNLETD
jgi:hypothetical protein